MSWKDGMAAINLEMPDRIPRTEYSLEFHWDVVNRVLGSHISSGSSQREKAAASAAFMKEWNYDFVWSVLAGNNIYDGKCSKMGHSEYEKDGVDRSDEKFTLFETPEEALAFDPWEIFGQRDLQKLKEDFNRHYQKNCMAVPDAVNMTGIYVTAMSGLIEVFGWDMLLTMAGLDPAGAGAVMRRYTEWMQQYFESLADCEAPVVMVHDDIVWSSGAFFHPDWYRNFLFPAYKKLFLPLQEKGKKIMYTSDGCYTQFIDDIAACGIHGFVLEPLTDMAYIAEQYGKSHVIVGNADTRVLLLGGKEDIYQEVKRCIDIGRNCPGYFLAVGNHIPPNTPADNVFWYNECYEKLSRR